jgi:hypothetical protein
MNEEKANKLLFLAVLSQTCVDALDEEIGSFKFKHKKVAKAFLEEHLKLMDKDFGSEVAVDQLVGLSVWIHDVFQIMLKVGKRTSLEQRLFQEDWENLLRKYEL